jgi:hypothetical protein
VAAMGPRVLCSDKSSSGAAGKSYAKLGGLTHNFL